MWMESGNSPLRTCIVRATKPTFCSVPLKPRLLIVSLINIYSLNAINNRLPRICVFWEVRALFRFSMKTNGKEFVMIILI